MTASSMAQQLPLQPNNNPSSGAAAAAALATTAASTRPQPAADQQGLRCPRCDSPNTKFCYYNNYSLTQPRHFCKSCRRYWTKGGALRNVPVGGGCRKPKRSRSSRLSSSPSSAATSSMQQLDPLARAGFDLSAMLPSYSYHPIPDSAFAAAAASSSSNHHLLHHGGGGGGGSIASSIQSLSSINQDLHWKLQQQRLHAMLAAAAGGGDRTQDSKGAETALGRVENHVNDVSLHGGDTTTTATAAAAAAWFLDPYSVPNVNTTNYHHSSATTNVNNGSTSASDWVGIPTWSHDTHHFAAFP